MTTAHIYSADSLPFMKMERDDFVGHHFAFRFSLNRLFSPIYRMQSTNSAVQKAGAKMTAMIYNLQSIVGSCGISFQLSSILIPLVSFSNTSIDFTIVICFPSGLIYSSVYLATNVFEFQMVFIQPALQQDDGFTPMHPQWPLMVS